MLLKETNTRNMLKQEVSALYAASLTTCAASLVEMLAFLVIKPSVGDAIPVTQGQ
jgi:hypothetical protein